MPSHNTKSQQFKSVWVKSFSGKSTFWNPTPICKTLRTVQTVALGGYTFSVSQMFVLWGRAENGSTTIKNKFWVLKPLLYFLDGSPRHLVDNFLSFMAEALNSFNWLFVALKLSRWIYLMAWKTLCSLNCNFFSKTDPKRGMLNKECVDRANSHANLHLISIK